MTTKIYQAYSYTTDHSDGDLIPACHFAPKVGDNALKESVEIIKGEIDGAVALCSEKGSDYAVTIECRVDGIWEEPFYVSELSDSQIKLMYERLAKGEIDTVCVTKPEWVNYCGQLIEEYCDVYGINVVELEINNTVTILGEA